MINKYMDPKLFNIDLLVLNEKTTPIGVKEVKELVIFEANTKTPHKDGLFSEEIFGPRGSERRNTHPGYINLFLPILHPLVYTTLISLDSKLSALAESKIYATFNNRTGAFEYNNKREGETGYSFMLEHIDKMKFANSSNSDKRDYKIKLMNAYLNTEFMSTRWLVLPAGLRDYIIDDDGRPSEDEINTLYRKLLATTNFLRNNNISKKNHKLLDPVRLKIQKTVVEIYNYIFTLLDGKHKFIQGKYSKRAIAYGTRNVITGLPTTIVDLTKPTNIGFNHTIVGIYQYVKAIAPITINRVQTVFINKILERNSNKAYLIDPNTYKSNLVQVSPKKKDEWFTTEGINDIMNKLSQPALRTEPVMVDKYYLALVHDDGKNVTVYTDTNYLPADIDYSALRPLTYVELFYISIYEVRDKYPGFVTRYPVTGLGSIYPTYLYVKTTSEGRNVNFEMGTMKLEMVEYPILDKDFVEGMTVAVSRLERLGGDHDGDTVSLNVVFSEEAIAEVKKHLETKGAYLSPEGNITFSCSDTTVDLVITELTE